MFLITLLFFFSLSLVMIQVTPHTLPPKIRNTVDSLILGAISGILAMSQFTDRFTTLNGNSYAQGLFVAAILLTAMLGSLLTGWVADKIGRKWTIMTGSFVYSFGIMFEIIGTNFGMLVAGRLIGGFGNGLLTNSVPLYQ
jgi:MFS family permease